MSKATWYPNNCHIRSDVNAKCLPYVTWNHNPCRLQWPNCSWAIATQNSSIWITKIVVIVVRLRIYWWWLLVLEELGFHSTAIRIRMRTQCRYEQYMISLTASHVNIIYHVWRIVPLTDDVSFGFTIVIHILPAIIDEQALRAEVLVNFMIWDSTESKQLQFLLTPKFIFSPRK